MRIRGNYCFFPVLPFVLGLGILQGAACADTLTVYGRTDAGLYPGQGAYLSFVDATDGHLLNTVDPSIPAWTSASQIYDYALAHGLANWQLNAAGDIWSPDLVVGEALTNLPAATYQITPVAGAYMYDGMGWDPAYAGKYWWELQIKANDVLLSGVVVPTAYYMLGSYDWYSSVDAAFAASQSLSKNITLAEGGSLEFWIWDWNSIDNSGSLTFQVSAIPEPSTLLLCATGVLMLLARRRK